MTTPERTPDTELEVQELTDENLEEASGGTAILTDRGSVLLRTNPATGVYIADGSSLDTSFS